ncbi:glycosyltransferase [Pseudarthrobacter scleromae]|uniref:glycosyltransferase n=1 Tax=Pseudarthrobacter scleromae TaxID=158897 RepID=UPI00362980C6
MRAAEAAEVAANSHFVQKRVKETWGRDSHVIYPPVDVEEIRAVEDWYEHLDSFEQAIAEDLPKNYIFGASRFIPYKRLDLVIRAGELTGLPVILAGAGPEEENLREQALRASVEVRFIRSPTDALLRTLYQRAAVYVFPPVEDFGIMPVECMAAGTPVVSNRQGGAGESVIDGVTGAHFEPDDDSSLVQAIELALSLDRSKISGTTLRFSRARFDLEIQEWTRAALERHRLDNGH